MKVLKSSGKNDIIDKIAGEWVQIEWNNHKGWVFNGYLSYSDPSFDGDSTLENIPGYENYPASTNNMYIVKEKLVPVFPKPGIEYEMDSYSEGMVDKNGEYLQNIITYLVYGNMIEAKEVSSHKDWVMISLPDSGNGFIRKNTLMKDIHHEDFESTEYIVSSEKATLYLLPGKRQIELELVKGDIVNAVGVYTHSNGDRWLKLVFNSVKDDGEEGIGKRYAWTRDKSLIKLKDYTPKVSSIEPAILPSLIRKKCSKNDFQKISDSIKNSLVKNGFYINPNPVDISYLIVDDMIDSYPDGSENYLPNFISVDLFLHSYHLIFSRMLQKIEQEYMYNYLETFLSGSLKTLGSTKDKLNNSNINNEALRKLYMLYAVPLGILNPSRPELKNLPYNSIISSEQKRVIAHEQCIKSLLTGKMMDYSMFTPRGHYTLSDKLEKYFMAMSYLCNGSLYLKMDNEQSTLSNLAAIALACKVMQKGSNLDSYEKIFKPITYLIGMTDDLTYYDFSEYVEKHIGDDLSRLDNPKYLTLIKEDILKNAKAPQIIDRITGPNKPQEQRVAENIGFRLMGARFVLDAYIFTRLTSPNVGTIERPRNLPKPEDVMCVFGSSAAKKILDEDKKWYPKYQKALENITVETADFPDNFWKKNVYSSWLDIFRAYFRKSACDQYFYNTDKWEYKKLLSSLGSWTELKHDTILYAKQSLAELGSGSFLYAAPYSPPIPRGYVEPDPDAFDRLVRCISMTENFLKKYGMFDDEYLEKLSQFGVITGVYRDIAAKEARGNKLTIEDYMEIHNIKNYINSRLILPWNSSNSIDDGDELKMALVVDYATDGFAKRVAYAAIGRPLEMMVFVNDDSGGPRVTVGYIYSYYQFIQPLGVSRMNNEQWKSMVYNTNKAATLKDYLPNWYGNFVQ